MLESPAFGTALHSERTAADGIPEALGELGGDRHGPGECGDAALVLGIG
jgi:hypothetical protein